jgi:hypothetical protein
MHNRSEILALFACLAWSVPVHAQDLEPRRWSHLPVGLNIAGLTYIYTDGDLEFDPVLQIDDATVDAHRVLASYSRALDVFGKTGRLDFLLPYQYSEWEGELAGEPASVDRDGLGDPWVRFSLNWIGAPALRGKEYLDYRAAHSTNTVLGSSVAVMLPLGRYEDDKLLNLGQNRFIIRPQTGLVHTRDSWSYEVTGSVFFFTENDEFFGETERKQDPLFAYQGHVVHTFPNRWWASLSGGYSWGGESEINGDSKDDKRGDLLSAASFGVPIGKSQSLKFVYLRGDTLEDVGSDTNSFAVSWLVRF